MSKQWCLHFVVNCLLWYICLEIFLENLGLSTFTNISLSHFLWILLSYQYHGRPWITVKFRYTPTTKKAAPSSVTKLFTPRLWQIDLVWITLKPLMSFQVGPLMLFDLFQNIPAQWTLYHICHLYICHFSDTESRIGTSLARYWHLRLKNELFLLLKITFSNITTYWNTVFVTVQSCSEMYKHVSCSAYRKINAVYMKFSKISYSTIMFINASAFTELNGITSLEMPQIWSKTLLEL